MVTLSRRYLWIIIGIVLLLFIGSAGFYYHSIKGSRSLRSVQTELQKAISQSDAVQSNQINALAERVVVLRKDVGDDIPSDLQSQYHDIVKRLNDLAGSSNQAVASAANEALAKLPNSAGIGIGVGGVDNSTISNTGVISINNQTGDIKILGKDNQTVINQNAGSVTVGTAQDIAQTSSPTFNNQTLSGNSTIQGNSSVQGSLNVGGNSATQGNTTTNGSTTTGSLTIQSSGTQNGYALCDASNNCGYSGAGSSFVQGGNSFGNPATIGTNDNNDFNIKTNGTNRITIDSAGSTSVIGNLSANSFAGDGSSLSNVNASGLNGQNGSFYQNASNLNAGTINDSRLSANVTTAGNTFNGANQLVMLTAGGLLPVIDGSNLQNVNASMLGGQSASYYTNASNLASGMLADARLSANVALKNTVNTFTSTNNFAGVTATGILQNGYQVCDASNNCNYASSSGSGNYIQNGTLAQIANFNIQSASASSVGAVIQGAVGQTADILRVKDANGLVTTSLSGGINQVLTIGAGTVDSRGQIFVRGYYNSAGNYIAINVASDGFIRTYGSTNSLNLGTSSSHGVYFSASGNNVGMINASGMRVGGTSGNPGGQLHVTSQLATRVGSIIQGYTGQTADLLQFQDSTGAVLAKIDTSGNLTVKNATVQGTLTVTDSATFNGNYITFSSNVRGYNVAVTSNSTTLTVNFPTAHPDADYAVMCTPNWDTTCFVSSKTAAGYTLNFGTAAPGSQLVDWFVVR